MSAPSESHNCHDSSPKLDASNASWLSTIGHYLRPSVLFSNTLCFLLLQQIVGTKRSPKWLLSSVTFPKRILVPFCPVEPDKERCRTHHRPTYAELQTELKKQTVQLKTAENALIILQREYESLRRKYVLLVELTKPIKSAEDENNANKVL